MRIDTNCVLGDSQSRQLVLADNMPSPEWHAFSKFQLQYKMILEYRFHRQVAEELVGYRIVTASQVFVECNPDPLVKTAEKSLAIVNHYYAGAQLMTIIMVKKTPSVIEILGIPV